MHLIFKIITQKNIEIDIPPGEMYKFPVFEHYLIEGRELVVIYKFNPAKNCDVEAYKLYLIKYLKKKYNAYSVTCGELQLQLKAGK